jgi:uncharacterized protein
MKRLVNPFLATLTLILAGLYAYLALRLTSGLAARTLLAVPFVLIWLVPAVYWFGDREGHRRLDDWIHAGSYTSMGWLSFAVLLCLLRDGALLATSATPALAAAHAFAQSPGDLVVLIGSMLALGAGMLLALAGPGIVAIDVPVMDLPPALDGLRIVQISDVHVGPTIGARYVRHIVERALSLKPDLYALTGDFVDGPVERLGPHLAPLAQLAADKPAFFVTGNHEYYSGARAWVEHFRGLGVRILQNEHAMLDVRGARLLVGGVNDPAAGRFDKAARPDAIRAAAAHVRADFRLLLAHNPKLASRAAQAGFGLMLSGHTHAGQFFPWTLAVRLVHAPHVAGLSREGTMWVYVSPGTGSWGPPVRFGTRPEITLLRLMKLGVRN